MTNAQPKAIRSLELMFSELRSIEADFPASYAAILVYVAKRTAAGGELPTLSEVADNVGIARPATSRAVLAMSDRRSRELREGSRKALGLLERMQDAQDYRMVRVRLTPKGAGLVNRLALLAKPD